MQLSPSLFEPLRAAARAAPSADNRLVHRIEFQPDRVLVRGAPDLAGAIQNRRVLGLISIGAVVENLLLRGARLGVDFEIRHLPAGRLDEPLVELRVSGRPATPQAIEQAIEDRHSNRRLLYSGSPLDALRAGELESQTRAVDGTSLVWLDGPTRRPQALRLIRWAETERFRQPDLHQEMFESIRFDVGWKAASPEGIPAGALELPALERPAFSLLRHWRVQRVANLAGLHRFIGFRGGDLPCRLAPNLGAIAAEGDLEDAAIRAGRLLQRLWLDATTMGLAMQVFAASPLFALPGSNFVSGDLRERLSAGWRALSPEALPYVVFRLGRARVASVRAGRPAEDA